MRRRSWPLLTAGAIGALAAVVPAVAAPAQTPPAESPAAMAWLHVAHPAEGRAQIVDSAGRTVILRGANLRGIEDDYYPVPGGAEPGPAPQYPIDPAAYQGQCPATRPGAGEPPVCQGDLAAIAAQGFNFIRLPISWSLLEPEPGSYSQEYLDRIAQVVGWAQAQGIYVLLDMHEDDYSRFVPGASESPNHADGAPPWAVMTGGLPAQSLGGQAELSLAVEGAFTAFWLNRVPTDASGQPQPQGAAPGPGLQDHYIGALAAVARRLRDDPTVAGYEIINEPLPGLIAPVAFSSAFLYPFYSRVIDALTGLAGGAGGYRDLGVHATRQSFFFEPMAVRNLEDAPDQAALPFTSYKNIVYAPHDYTHVFTLDRDLGLAPSSSPYPLSYDQPYQVAGAEARAMRAALICGEFGEFSGNPATYGEVVGGMTSAQDRFLVGSSYWAWTDGPVSPLLSRVYPAATAGALLGFSYTPATRAFVMTAADRRAVRPGDRAAETEVTIPAGVHGAVSVAGAARLDQVVAHADGTRTAYVAPTGAGSYSVAVSS